MPWRMTGPVTQMWFPPPAQPTEPAPPGRMVVGINYVPPPPPVRPVPAISNDNTYRTGAPVDSNGNVIPGNIEPENMFGMLPTWAWVIAGALIIYYLID